MDNTRCSTSSKQRVDLALFVVRARGTFRAGADDLAQHVFLPDDLQVVPRVRRRGREGKQVRDERRAADHVEQVAVAQRLREA